MYALFLSANNVINGIIGTTEREAATYTADHILVQDLPADFFNMPPNSYAVVDRETGEISIVTEPQQPNSKTLDEKLDRVSNENLSLMLALADVYEQLLTMNAGGRV